jgi:hypothetical protein
MEKPSRGGEKRIAVWASPPEDRGSDDVIAPPEGLSLGIVLTADGRSVKYINEHGYFKKWPVNDINYPQYGKQLQGIYNKSVVAGIGHGRQFNTVASKNLFMFIQARMTDYAKADFQGDPASWSSKTWENYYRLCAAILQRKINLR